MRLKHPYSLDDDAPDPDDTVHWGGRRRWSDVADDGTFEVPDRRAEQFVASWPTAEGYDLEDLRVDEESGPAGDDDAKDAEDEADETDTEADTPDEEADEDTCQEVMTNGEVCGRDRPCPYHDDEED